MLKDNTQGRNNTVGSKEETIIINNYLDHFDSEITKAIGIIEGNEQHAAKTLQVNKILESLLTTIDFYKDKNENIEIIKRFLNNFKSYQKNSKDLTDKLTFNLSNLKTALENAVEKIYKGKDKYESHHKDINNMWEKFFYLPTVRPTEYRHIIAKLGKLYDNIALSANTANSSSENVDLEAVGKEEWDGQDCVGDRSCGNNLGTVKYKRKRNSSDDNTIEEFENLTLENGTENSTTSSGKKKMPIAPRLNFLELFIEEQPVKKKRKTGPESEQDENTEFAVMETDENMNEGEEHQNSNGRKLGF